MPEPNVPHIYTVVIDETGTIILPEEVIEALGWQEDCDLVWEIQEDESLLIYKVDKNLPNSALTTTEQTDGSPDAQDLAGEIG